MRICEIELSGAGLAVFDLEYPNLPLDAEHSCRFTVGSGKGALRIFRGECGEVTSTVEGWRLQVPSGSAAFDWLTLTFEDSGRIAVVADLQFLEQYWTAGGPLNVTKLTAPVEIFDRCVAALESEGLRLHPPQPIMQRVSETFTTFAHPLLPDDLKRAEKVLSEALTAQEWAELERSPDELIRVIRHHSKEAVLADMGSEPCVVLSSREIIYGAAVRLSPHHFHYALELSSCESGWLLTCSPMGLR